MKRRECEKCGGKLKKITSVDKYDPIGKDQMKKAKKEGYTHYCTMCRRLYRIKKKG